IRAAAGAAKRARTTLRDDVDHLRLDAGWSAGELARASGVDPGYLHRILNGVERPSLETYAKLTAALGADLALRAYPNTGPAIRDRHSAPMLELLLAAAHPRFSRYLEVAVRRPSRGWIDALLHEPRERLAIASELQSELRRLEQLVRWQAAKADSLPSWEGWPHLGDEPQITRLLVVRRTRATRAVVTDYAHQLRVAYPAHPDDVLTALTGTAPWPGPALVWATVDARGARFVSGR
ncbi:MAG TPA: helix-turn-helix transcriptional regulator, partial [Candidatus Limnocylindrales bacterium]|nr:helix-turn-helix transcriptional regulator [Candidatus Limnocylindrales bacterium]